MFKDRKEVSKLPSVMHQYACQQCKLVPNSTLILQGDECGHFLCAACFPNYSTQKYKCQVEKCETAEQDQTFSAPKKFILKELDKQLVSCNNHEQYGCDWKGPWSSLQEHLNYDCDYSLAQCENSTDTLGAKCGVEMTRHELREKHAPNCKWRRIVCDVCSQQLFFMNFGAHEHTCQLCKETLKNLSTVQEYEQHRLQQCRKRLVMCNYQPMGCTWKGTAESLDLHLTKQCTFNQQQQQQQQQLNNTTAATPAAPASSSTATALPALDASSIKSVGDATKVLQTHHAAIYTTQASIEEIKAQNQVLFQELEQVKSTVNAQTSILTPILRETGDVKQILHAQSAYISNLQQLSAALQHQNAIIQQENEHLKRQLLDHSEALDIAMRAVGNVQTQFGRLVLKRSLLFSASQDNTIKMWEMNSASCISILSGHSSYVNNLLARGDEYLISGGSDSTIRVWDIHTKKNTRTIKADHEVWHLQWWNFDHLVECGNGPNIKVWKFENGSKVKTLQGHTSYVHRLVVSGNNLYSCSYDKTLKYWDLESGNCLNTFTGHTDVIHDLAKMDRNMLVSGGRDCALNFWDIETGQCLLSFQNSHDNWIWSLDFNLDKQLVLSAGADKCLKLWDFRSKKCVTVVQNAHNAGVVHAKLWNHGTQIITGGHKADPRILIWDFSEMRILKQFKGHQDSVWSTQPITQ